MFHTSPLLSRAIVLSGGGAMQIQEQRQRTVGEGHNPALVDMTMPDLRRVARDNGIKVYPQGRPLRKEQLITELESAGISV